jgi:hypothetical protein
MRDEGQLRARRVNVNSGEVKSRKKNRSAHDDSNIWVELHDANGPPEGEGRENNKRSSI